MATGMTLQTRLLTREQISEITGNNPRAIRVIEGLTRDVSQAIPAAVDGNTAAVAAVSALASSAAAAAERAEAAAAEVVEAQAASRSYASQIDELRRALGDIQALLLAS